MTESGSGDCLVASPSSGLTGRHEVQPATIMLCYNTLPVTLAKNGTLLWHLALKFPNLSVHDYLLFQKIKNQLQGIYFKSVENF